MPASSPIAFLLRTPQDVPVLVRTHAWAVTRKWWIQHNIYSPRACCGYMSCVLFQAQVRLLPSSKTHLTVTYTFCFYSMPFTSPRSLPRRHRNAVYVVFVLSSLLSLIVRPPARLAFFHVLLFLLVRHLQPPPRPTPPSLPCDRICPIRPPNSRLLLFFYYLFLDLLFSLGQFIVPQPLSSTSTSLPARAF